MSGWMNEGMNELVSIKNKEGNCKTVRIKKKKPNPMEKGEINFAS